MQFVPIPNPICHKWGKQRGSVGIGTVGVVRECLELSMGYIYAGDSEGLSSFKFSSKKFILFVP